MTSIEITLNGTRFDLIQGTIQEYSRELNIQTGLLTRKVIWTSLKGDEFVLTFERMVSLKRLHTIAARVSITPEHDAAITFQSGIDGRVTCDSSQHFTEGETRFYDKKYLQFTPKTIQSGITFVIGAKGLSGEGYKGHTFWDTEIFLLPYFIFNMPEVARSLKEYRYLSLPGAHAKAKHNGYEGAQFPWESAWLDDGAAWEGFDCVSPLVIPRLPFARPDAVKEKERQQYPTLHAFIRAVVVPEIQIKLKQGFGRAIRTETDTCVVAILDERAAEELKAARRLAVEKYRPSTVWE